ncbi:hypothetical protein [Dolichospermum circinale]|nr:hypothetical protein [Dolichospermum circinale]MDB9476362.1 hypothetical protein [Dolichospermum circinale CS-537/11]MDB9480202.1 hypothetical protein [Dolichospermum circinale CS-537/03]MDB9481812.1 hypothetical protein [Dolichospermum circinale CS-537/05]MDB9546567.1 hypothetical protein [Dolichospermum circinale CS-1031]
MNHEGGKAAKEEGKEALLKPGMNLGVEPRIPTHGRSLQGF